MVSTELGVIIVKPKVENNKLRIVEDLNVKLAKNKRTEMMYGLNFKIKEGKID